MSISKKSYAKVNIFLKIAGKRGNYHLLVSRFVRVKSLYDTITFKEGLYEEFTLEGKFGCKTTSNTIYKAYMKLKDISSSVEEYFKTNKVIVEKHIPEFAGLGGGSSNCSTFILMVNDVCNLNLSKDELSHIGASIGADVPFFIYEYDSANVTGVGEVVKEFKEEPLDIYTITPKVQCDTGAIFREFRDKFYKEVSIDEANKLQSMKSKDILTLLNPRQANDLYAPASSVYKELRLENMNFETTYHFSGSGSSFFTVNYNRKK